MKSCNPVSVLSNERYTVRVQEFPIYVSVIAKKGILDSSALCFADIFSAVPLFRFYLLYVSLSNYNVYQYI